MAIRQNLAAAGVDVGDMDEETLMRFALKMFADEGEADDIAGEFADQLLGKGGEESDEDRNEDDNEGAFSQWVAQQAEEKASKRQPGKDLPTPADSEGKPSATPPNKRPPIPASMVGATSVNNTSPVHDRGRKRKADDPVEENIAKRPVRRFDAPTAASKARIAGPAVGKVIRRGRKG